MKVSQERAILSHLKRGKKIDSMIALNRFGVFRLSARIFNLIGMGHKIKSRLVWHGKKHWSEYSL